MIKKQNEPDVISDFGKQWQEYTDNRGFYGSQDALVSLIEPLMRVDDLDNCTIADVGAGTGRYTMMFRRANAKKVVAIEPSDAFSVLERNVTGIPGIECLKRRAEQIPDDQGFDLVFCIGVLQFIANPEPALKAMGKALKRGGRLFLWVYAKEQNSPYLMFVLPMRRITTHLPHDILKMLTWIILPFAELYALTSRVFKGLPLASYLENYFLKLDRYTRRIVIHDQLNPRYVKFYRKDELETLLETCGFRNIKMHHRMGYSWSVYAQYQED